MSLQRLRAGKRASSSVYLETVLCSPPFFLGVDMGFDRGDALEKIHLVTPVTAFFKVHAFQNAAFVLTHSIPLLPAARAH